ncbi:MAG: hypothetical protein HY313_09190 [Acidobacteria bacterium]|nr:hypothetical protein [Acidobacteriota bacterium]
MTYWGYLWIAFDSANASDSKTLPTNSSLPYVPSEPTKRLSAGTDKRTCKVLHFHDNALDYFLEVLPYLVVIRIFF